LSNRTLVIVGASVGFVVLAAHLLANYHNPLPVLPSASRSVEELDQRRYIEADDGAAGPVTLRWDLARDGKLVYEYSRQGRLTVSTGGRARPCRDGDGGRLVVGFPPDGEARVVLSRKGGDIDPGFLAETGLVPDGGDVDMLLLEVGPGGRPKPGKIPVDPYMLCVLPPLPGGAILVGESFETERGFAVEGLLGERYDVTGTVSTTLAAYVKVAGRTCARLETRVDVAEIELPKGHHGLVEFGVRARGISYFDIEEGRLVSSEAAVVVAFRVEAPMPPDVEPDAEGNELPERVWLAVDSDCLVRLDLVEAELAEPSGPAADGAE
jgi:hypothetical protein